MGTLPDGSVTGYIQGGDTTASFSAGVTCFGGGPSGSINGTITTFTGSGTSTFTFLSDNAFIVGTLLSEGFVHAEFDNVTLKRGSTVVSNNCTAFLTAKELTSNTWIGSLSIVCPGGTQLDVFGIFTGEVSVLQTVLCKPLL